MPDTEIIVHVVDDEEAVRASLAFLLASAGLAVRVHASAAEFLAIANRIHNGCLITDLRMPDIDGVELLARLREQGNMLPAIVITGHGDVQMAVAAMKNGALDFLEKPFSDEVLLASIRRAVTLAASRHGATLARNRTIERLKSLGGRELEVLKRVVEGQPNKAIALELGLSSRTVEVYRAGLMSKMQAENLADLVRMVMAVDIPEPPADAPGAP